MSVQSSQAALAAHTPEAVAALYKAPPERIFRIQRTLAAPPDLVWRVWTDPAQIPNWWGPRGTIYKAEVFEFHVGGAWRLVMVEPPGGNHTFMGRFFEIDAPYRLAQSFEWLGDPGSLMLEVITFEPVAGGTRVTDATYFGTQAGYDNMLEPGVEEGVNEPFDRLADVLAALQQHHVQG